MCQSLGCSLDEVVVLLGPDGAAVRRELAARKLADVDAAMARLAAVHPVLSHLAECRHTDVEQDECRAAVRGSLTRLDAQPGPAG